MKLESDAQQSLYNDLYKYIKDNGLVNSGPQGAFIVLESPHIDNMYVITRKYRYNDDQNKFKQMINFIFNKIMIGF